METLSQTISVYLFHFSIIKFRDFLLENKIPRLFPYWNFLLFPPISLIHGKPDKRPALLTIFFNKFRHKFHNHLAIRVLYLPFQIHCTSILIGVHGAGLEWCQFLPQEAALLELGWRQYEPGLYTILAKRRGLIGDVMTTDNVTIDWSSFVAANGLSTLTESDKQKHLASWASRPVYKDHNPYKFGLGYFDARRFSEKIQTMIRGLEQKFNVKL